MGVFIFRFIFALGTAYYTLEPISWILSLLIFLGLPISIFAIKKIATRNPILNIQYSILIFLPFLWTFFDHLQARYSLLPTYIIAAGNALGSSPFLGLASTGGLITLTFFAALINILIVFFILKIKTLNPKFYILYSFIIIFIIIIGWQISQFELRKNAENYANLKNSIKIAAVSINENFSETDIAELKNNLADQKIDLLILPENILKNNLNSGQYELLASETAKSIGINLLAVFDTFENGKKYNSAVLFDSKGKIIGSHNKNRLTFIGEYWPFGKWQPFYLRWLKNNNPKIKNYAVFNVENSYKKGDKKNLSMNIGDKIIPLAPLICLEIHYPKDLKKYRKTGALFIANQTSNRWINNGLNHLLYLSNNLRKIESVWLKMPVISSGVKDYAAVIEPDGKIYSAYFENSNGKNYNLLFREIRY